MLRTDPQWVPEEWLLRPRFKFWPPQRQRAVLWTLAQFAGFRSQLERNLTFQDYVYRLLTAIQAQVRWEKEPDNTGGQLP